MLLLLLSDHDIHTRMLPDRYVLILGVLGVFYGLVSALLLCFSSAFPSPTLSSFLVAYAPLFSRSFWGFLAGFCVPLLIAQGALWLTGRDGIGGGDIKLLGALGIWLGPGVIGVLMLGSLCACVVMAIRALCRFVLVRATGEPQSPLRTTFAFGPYLAFAAGVQFFFAADIPFLL